MIAQMGKRRGKARQKLPRGAGCSAGPPPPPVVTNLSGRAACGLGGDGAWCLGHSHLRHTSELPLSRGEPVFVGEVLLAGTV